MKAKEVKLFCIEEDRRCKKLAAEYKKTTRKLKQRIEIIKIELNRLELKATAKIDLEERLKILNQMYRTTNEIGCEAEHYYEKGWWRSENYTLNTR